MADGTNPLDGAPDAVGHSHQCVICQRNFACFNNPCVIGSYVCASDQGQDPTPSNIPTTEEP